MCSSFVSNGPSESYLVAIFDHCYECQASGGRITLPNGNANPNDAKPMYSCYSLDLSECLD